MISSPINIGLVTFGWTLSVLCSTFEVIFQTWMMFPRMDTSLINRFCNLVVGTILILVIMIFIIFDGK